MVKKKVVTKTKKATVAKPRVVQQVDEIEEPAILKVEKKTVKKQSDQSKNQTNQSGA